MILERREGYAIEKGKIELLNFSVLHFVQQCFTHAMLLSEIEDGMFKSMTWKQQGSDVDVSWDPINPKEQPAFIQGYVLYCLNINNNISINVSTGIVTQLFIYTHCQITQQVWFQGTLQNNIFTNLAALFQVDFSITGCLF